jgi:Domain of unknown function (DUF1707)
MSEVPRRYAPSSMKASDADRDAVLTELGEHFKAGRLTSDELDERTGQALLARTFGELAPLMADLPPLTTGGPADGADGPAGGVPATAGRPRQPILVPVLLGLVATAVVGRTLSGMGTGAGSSHLWWLILILPLVARWIGARGRR